MPKGALPKGPVTAGAASIMTPAAKRFVVHWGEMGTRWGVNRTVAQIHALLFIAPEPLNAEQIADALIVARSNVSTSLRELQGWGLVRVVHMLGDRRDYFEPIKEPWEMFRIILNERKRREIDPTIDALRECVQESRERSDGHAQERLAELLAFFETMDGWYRDMAQMPTAKVKRFVKLGDRIRRML
ncbi:MAG: MarR family transcriptional regulator [Planctomycetota bacterium]